MKALHHSGDTIVEVLLAIAIVSMALGGAYTSVRRSLFATQQAQERSQATKVAETQIERLKATATNPSKGVFTSAPGSFCLDSSLNFVSPTCNDGPSNLYTVRLLRDPFVSGDNHLFRAHITWSRIGGGGQEDLKIYYRLYE